MAEELQPYLLYRISEDQQARFATWRLEQGNEALVLFHTEQAAALYQQQARLSPPWITLRPEKDILLQILGNCEQAGIFYAVLNPTDQQAQLVFDIPQILAKVAQAPPAS